MIKAAGETKDGKPLLILGLSTTNKELLLVDRPILVTAAEMAEMGLPEINIALVGGETEDDLVNQFRQAGVTAKVRRK